MLWTGWAAGRGAERRSGAQLVFSPMPSGPLEALWVPGGRREDQWKHLQRGVPAGNLGMREQACRKSWEV